VLSLTISVLLIVAVATFVAAPFLARNGPAETDGGERRIPADRRKLEARKLEAYAAIKEAEFDHRMGKLSDDDLARSREKYTREAVDAIAALEEGPAELRRLGEGRTGRVSPRTTGQRASTSKPTRTAFCPACGHGVPPRANFCPACGRSLTEEVA